MSSCLTMDELQAMIRMWLAEDMGDGDMTTLATVPEQHESIGIIHMKDEGIIAGLPVAEAVFRDSGQQLAISRSYGRRRQGRARGCHRPRSRPYTQHPDRGAACP